jgi:hypothetical protein
MHLLCFCFENDFQNVCMQFIILPTMRSRTLHLLPHPTVFCLISNLLNSLQHWIGIQFPSTMLRGLICNVKEEAEVSLQPILNPAVEGGGWSAQPFGRLTPGNTLFPLYKWMGGLPRIVQPAASRYTDYALPATYLR